MSSLHRTVLPALNAAFITAALLYLMFLLIDSEQPELLRKTTLPNLTWSDIPKETPPDFGYKKPTPPKEVAVAPPVQFDNTKFEFIEDGAVTWTEPVIRSSGPGLRLPDNNQLILAIGFPPRYPSTALTRSIEGYAIVGFSVTASGEVYDPFIIESEPKNIFNKSSLKAISKFKYKPKMVDGKPVSVDGQRYMFTYRLDNS